MSPAGLRRTMTAFFLRDLQVSVSYKVPFVIEIVGIFVTVVTMWFLSKIVDPALVPGGYFTFVVMGLALAVFLDAGVVRVATNLREEQLLGTLEATVGCGIAPNAMAAGMASYPLAAAVFTATVYVVLSIPFGLTAPSADWSLALAAALIGSISFAGIGLMGAALVLVLRRAAGAVAWIAALLGLTAGEFFPPELLPDWLRALSLLSPFTWCLHLVRAAVIDGASIADEWRGLTVLSVMALAYSILGIASLRWALGHARRRGTLGQY